MNKYTILCTPEQTKKALELGAQIAIYGNGEMSAEIAKKYNFTPINGVTYIIPTAEQMIGWLEEQGLTSIEITFCKESKWMFEIFGEIYDYGAPYFSRKEATLAAIDAALDYLLKAKDE